MATRAKRLAGKAVAEGGRFESTILENGLDVAPRCDMILPFGVHY